MPKWDKPPVRPVKASTMRELSIASDPTVVRQVEVASLLQRMAGAVDKALVSLEAQDEMGPREIGALSNLAKILPLLQQAEEAREGRVGNKRLRDMTNAELKRLAGTVLRSASEVTEEGEDDDG